MKKSLIALAVLASIAGVAQAQSAVTIYGTVDLGVTKFNGDTDEANAGRGLDLNDATQLQGNHASRIGFKGTEDLGGGLSAIFQFENRFNADTGALPDDQPLFSGPAYVGLAGGFGAVKLGRNRSTINSVSSAAIDPFADQGEARGVGGLFSVTRPRINNTVTYYTPEMSGFGAQAQYILGEDSTVGFDRPEIATADQNNGYAVGVNYNNGPIYLGAGYGVEENSDKSNIWALSGSYAFGPAKIALGYDQLTNKLEDGEPKVKNAVIAGTYEIGAGLIKAAYGQTRSEFDGDDLKDHKLSIGYQHNLSKRTSLYADISRTRFDLVTDDADVNGINVGVTHNF